MRIVTALFAVCTLLASASAAQDAPIAPEDLLRPKPPVLTPTKKKNQPTVRGPAVPALKPAQRWFPRIHRMRSEFRARFEVWRPTIDLDSDEIGAGMIISHDREFGLDGDWAMRGDLEWIFDGANRGMGLSARAGFQHIVSQGSNLAIPRTVNHFGLAIPAGSTVREDLTYTVAWIGMGARTFTDRIEFSGTLMFPAVTVLHEKLLVVNTATEAINGVTGIGAGFTGEMRVTISRGVAFRATMQLIGTSSWFTVGNCDCLRDVQLHFSSDAALVFVPMRSGPSFSIGYRFLYVHMYERDGLGARTSWMLTAHGPVVSIGINF